MTDLINHVPGTTPDFTTEAAKKLVDLFPEIVADGKIDLDKLKMLLGGGGGRRGRP
ncbi:hypothetical protein [Corynebacterium zhongnanshanii]|uniref:hypothetical protein n=1 Tax=Corynebacterium zhongnanshanii TaxID=2768834 RepID=UPI00192DF467